MATVNVTFDSFEDAVLRDGIAFVDFWSDWCGPCRRFAPVFEAVSEQHPDITFGRVDIDAERRLATEARIESIPTVMAFRDGVLVFAQPGAMSAAGLEHVIQLVRDLDINEVRRQTADGSA